MNEDKVTCSSCFHEFEKKRYCPYCGADSWQAVPVTTERVIPGQNRRFAPRTTVYRVSDDLPWKKPWVAAVLGGLVIGAGHIYARRYLEGAFLFMLAVTLAYLTMNLFLQALYALAVLWTIQIWLAYDAAEEFDIGVFERPEEFH